MRKREKENLRIQLGERFYDYVEKCRKFLGWNQKIGRASCRERV